MGDGVTDNGGGRMTVFGATLLELMARRGVTQWKELSELLRRAGYDYKPQRISNWAFGRHPADKRFGRAVSEVLGLNDDEVTRLARAYMLGQDRPVQVLEVGEAPSG